MTLIADGRAGSTLEQGDRRRASLEPRRSWASPQPVVPRAPLADAREAAEKWHRILLTYRRDVVLLDLLTSFLAALLAGSTAIGTTPAALSWAGLGAAVVVCVVAALGGYEVAALGAGPREFQVIGRAGLVLAAMLVALAYFAQLAVPRSVVLVGVPALVLLLSGGRWQRRRSLHRVRREGSALMPTLVVGEREEAGRVVQELVASPHEGFRVVGVCVPGFDPEEELAGDGTDVGAAVLGGAADVVQVVADHAVEVVVVTGAGYGPPALRRLSWALGRVGARLVVAPNLVDDDGPRIALQPTAGSMMLSVAVDAPRRQQIGKAVLDRVLGSMLLLAAAPVIAISALLVRLTSSGPAFYAQTRVGIDGKTFTMWKVRSMVVDAEERLAALRAQSDADGVLFKMQADPRVTRVGRVLRRFSLDELPQLLNVVRGDMSLVGPRPPLLSEVENYPDAAHRRLRVRPGLTGLWQVSGRSDLSWEEAMRLDLRYVDSWSLTVDLMILWKTGRAVLAGAGAY